MIYGLSAHFMAIFFKTDTCYDNCDLCFRRLSSILKISLDILLNLHHSRNLTRSVLLIIECRFSALTN